MNNIKKLLVLFIITIPLLINGQISEIIEDTINYSDMNGLKNGKWIEYLSIMNYPDSLECHFNYLDGKKNGECNCYYKNEEIAITGNYISDIETGIWSYQKDNGLEDYRIIYEKGEINHKVYYEYLIEGYQVEVNRITYKDKNDNVLRIEHYKDYVLVDTEYPKINEYIPFNNCLVSFNGTKEFNKTTADKRTSSSRVLKTEYGEKEISVNTGYRIVYNNIYNKPFVNLKVEQSLKSNFKNDTILIIDNLKYAISNSSGMESESLIKMNISGSDLYGLSRSNIKEGNILSNFVMFLDDDVIVYFYFNNIEPQFRTFDNIKEYKIQRNSFIEKYVEYIKKCKK